MKIKHKLPLLTVLIAILPIIIISATSYNILIDFSKENYIQIMLNQSQASLKHVQDFYSTQVSTAQYSAELEETVNFLDAYENKSTDIKRLVTQVSNTLKIAKETNIYLNSSTIISKEGVIISSSSLDSLGKDHSQCKLFKKVISTGEISSDIILDSQNSKDIVLAVPIKNKNGQTAGVLERVLNLQYLNNYINDLKIGDTGYMYIIDQYGQTLSHYYSDRVNFVEDEDNELSALQNLLNQQKNKTLKNPTGFFSYVIENQKINAYYSIEPNTNWMIVVAIPYDEINEVAKNSTNAIFVLSIIITIGAGIIGFFISKSIINPLSKFQAKIEQIAKGKFNERLIYKRKDEFGILAQNINTMAESLEASEKALLSLALDDELTRMANRKSIYLTMNNYFSKDQNQAIILLDLDGFKEINDTLGHDFGDKALIEVANILKNQATDKIFPARLGGDEFLIFISHYNKAHEIEALAKTILTNINSITEIHSIQINISASIGISIKQDESTYNQLIKKADIAMYKVKESGKSGIQKYQEA